jgi:hypothetical protein
MPKGESFFVKAARENREFKAAQKRRPDPMAEARKIFDVIEAPDEPSAVDVYLAGMAPKAESVSAYLGSMSPRGESVSDVLRRVSKTEIFR